MAAGTRRSINHELVGLLTPRERIWQAARKLRHFTLMELQDAIKPVVLISTCEKYVEALLRAGILRSESDPTFKAHGVIQRRKYTILKDSFEAPRIDRKGKAHNAGMGKLAMWRAMKTLRDFDWRDIQRAASTPEFPLAEASVRTYVGFLAKAGYFKALSVRSNGHPTRYRLVRDTGAHAPALTRRNAVFDRNTGEFTWQQSAQEVCDGLE